MIIVNDIIYRWGMRMSQLVWECRKCDQCCYDYPYFTVNSLLQIVSIIEKISTIFLSLLITVCKNPFGKLTVRPSRNSCDLIRVVKPRKVQVRSSLLMRSGKKIIFMLRSHDFMSCAHVGTKPGAYWGHTNQKREPRFNYWATANCFSGYESILPV